MHDLAGGSSQGHRAPGQGGVRVRAPGDGVQIDDHVDEVVGAVHLDLGPTDPVRVAKGGQGQAVAAGRHVAHPGRQRVRRGQPERQQAEDALGRLRALLADLGLEPKEAETRIVHLADDGRGFDFLGFGHKWGAIAGRAGSARSRLPGPLALDQGDAACPRSGP